MDSPSRFVASSFRSRASGPNGSSHGAGDPGASMRIPTAADPSSPRASRGRRVVHTVFTCLVATAGLSMLACNRDAPASGGITGAAMRADLTAPTGPGEIDVTVVHPNGTALSGNDSYLVAVVDASNGYVWTDLATAAAPTVAIRDLPLGGFCTMAIPANSKQFKQNFQGPPTTPVDLGDGSPTGYAATLSGQKSGNSVPSVSLSKQNFLTDCMSSPSITLHNGHPYDITLTLQTGVTFTADLADAGGSSTDLTKVNLNGFVNGYVGIPLSWSDVEPWYPNGVPQGYRPNDVPMILVAANPGAPTVPLVVDPNVTDQFVFQSDFLPLNTTANLTGERYFFASDLTGSSAPTTSVRALSTPSDPSLPVTNEPFVCQVNNVAENYGDGTQVDFGPVVADGYQASKADFSAISNAVAVWWHQTGSGSVTFTLRDRTTDGGTQKLQSTLSPNGSGGWTETSVNGGLLSVTGFSHEWGVTDDAGTTRIWYSAEGLPAGDYSWSVSTAGDQIPDASKSDQSSAFVSFGPPPTTSCANTNNDISFIFP